MSKQDSLTRCEPQNKVLNVKIDFPPQCEFEYSAECRPGEPNIELYIRILNTVLNIDLESRIQNSTLRF